MDHFQSVTELPGEPVSTRQIERLVNRYVWASQYCGDADVVEAACGTGPGLGLLASTARSVEAGDISQPILERASAYYGNRISMQQFDAQRMPFADASKDTVLLFEALYYLPDPEAFVREAARILRPEGHLLIATANKDIWDFHPSAFTHRYFGVKELGELLAAGGFECTFFGFEDIAAGGLLSQLLRPIKRLAVMTGLMPKTMSGKRWLKRMVFGVPVPMPSEIKPEHAPYVAPAALDPHKPDVTHRIIYCAAQLKATNHL